MKNKLFRLIPFFILVYFFLHFTIDYFYFLAPINVFISFIKYVAGVGLLYVAGYKIFRAKEKFVLAFSTILFIFLFFGSLTDTARRYNIFYPTSYLNQTIAFLAVGLVIIVFTKWARARTVIHFLSFWVVYCSIMIIYDIGAAVVSTKKEKIYLTQPAQLDINTNSTKPSIFYLVFDMYPSDTIFQEYLKYDNSSLSYFLKEKNFFVTGNAHSLYAETYYSLSSTLNLETLKFYTDSTIEKYKKVLIALKKAENSSLLSAFEKAGYEIKNFSVFKLQGRASPLHFNLNYHTNNALTSATFFNRVYQNIEPDFLLASKKIDLRTFKSSWSDDVKKDMEYLDSNFNQLLNGFSTNNKPAFNYFHFMIPHPPLLYDSSGNENPVKERYFLSGYEKGMEKYISYTKYGNQKIRYMVNKIFEKAGQNIIIIIQGDHGFREYSDGFPDEVRSGILNAVYLPNKNYANFNDTMNPVYTFKQILNNQFGTFLK